MALLPAREGRFAAPIVDGSHGAERGQAAGTILPPAGFEPVGAGPLPAAFVDEGLGNQGAVCALCLIHHRHQASEELRKELWILRS
ncbi:MAG TPA: hypothetical protein VGG43_05020 [Acidimicrobiales bacterium]